MDPLNTFESKLLKIETDLFNLYIELGDVVKKLENTPDIYKPDLRRIQAEYNTIKYILCGDFGYCPHKDTIVKNPTYREGQTYHTMNAMKLTDILNST
jgi:hypothetical protein